MSVPTYGDLPNEIFVRPDPHGDAPDVAIKCCCGRVIVHRTTLKTVKCDNCGEVWFERPTLRSMSSPWKVAEIVPLPSSNSEDER